MSYDANVDYYKNYEYEIDIYNAIHLENDMAKAYDILYKSEYNFILSEILKRNAINQFLDNQSLLDIEDVISEIMLLAIMNIDRFDPAKGHLTTFLANQIMDDWFLNRRGKESGKSLHYLRIIRKMDSYDDERKIKGLERATKLDYYFNMNPERNIDTKYQRDEVSEATIRICMDLRVSGSVVSLDAQLNEKKNDVSIYNNDFYSTSPEKALESKEKTNAIRNVIALLEPKELAVLCCYMPYLIDSYSDILEENGWSSIVNEFYSWENYKPDSDMKFSHVFISKALNMSVNNVSELWGKVQYKLRENISKNSLIPYNVSYKKEDNRELAYIPVDISKVNMDLMEELDLNEGLVNINTQK